MQAPPPVICLTMNPSVDVFTHTDHVIPADKLRCAAAQREPGGGGLNVARVIQRLGGPCLAVYPAGGASGAWLDAHLTQAGLPLRRLPIEGDTRESFTVLAQDTGLEYRFVLPGPVLRESEWRACLDAIDPLVSPGALLVASGSLPPGVPSDFYAQLSERARCRGARMVLDSSGAALREGLRAGVFLLKPNLLELSELLGQALLAEDQWLPAARSLIEEGRTDIVALSLGERGALLVTAQQAWRAPALPITPCSTVGAGDSFVGAMVWALQQGRALPEAFRWAMAAGSATLMAPGTGLCRLEDVTRLQAQVRVQELQPGARS